MLRTDGPAALPWWLRPAARRGWRAALGLALLAVAWLAFDPAPPPAADTGWDKANHVLAFAVLAWLASLAAWPHPRHRLAVAAGLLAYGVLIEAVQSQLPARSAEWADLAADAVGIACGLLAAAPWLRAPTMAPPR